MAKIEITKTELVWPGKYNEDGTHLVNTVMTTTERNLEQLRLFSLG